MSLSRLISLQPDHRCRRFVLAENIGQALRELPFEPGSECQADVVDKTGNRDTEKRLPLGEKVGANRLGIKRESRGHG